MKQKNFLLKLWIVLVVITGIGYVYLDRPIANFVDAHNVRTLLSPYLKNVVEIPSVVNWCAPLLAGLIAFAFSFNVLRTRFLQAIFLICLNLSVIYPIKNFLKWCFSRYWPTTWKDNNLSWIQNHAYGFNWFVGEPFNARDAMASFPSGHSTVIFAIMGLVSLLYPKLRVFAFAIAFFEAATLVLFNYHFFSDVTAGMLLGWTSAIIAYHVYKNRLNSRHSV